MFSIGHFMDDSQVTDLYLQGALDFVFSISIWKIKIYCNHGWIRDLRNLAIDLTNRLDPKKSFPIWEMLRVIQSSDAI